MKKTKKLFSTDEIILLHSFDSLNLGISLPSRKIHHNESPKKQQFVREVGVVITTSRSISCVQLWKMENSIENHETQAK